MPNKLFEVAFAGVPICVSNLPEMSKFVSELGIGVIMDETRPDSIAGSIAFVLKNKGRFALTDAAKQILQEKYCWPRQAENLLQAYGELEGANVNTENRVQI
jgi:glycosyltransferase involved in cell wall biosynthesis